MSAIVFSHGNSFPASTYRVMLDSLRARGYQVSAIEKYGHDPAYPVTDSWPTSPPSASRKRAASRCGWWAIRWAAS